MKQRYDSYKPSGIDWIGEIPSHWTQSKLKYHIYIDSGDYISKDEISDDNIIPVFGGGEQIGYAAKSNVSENTLIIGRVGARCGCVTPIIQQAWATDNSLICIPKKNFKFLYYLLLAANLNKLNESNAQPLITSTKVKNLVIGMPPLSEQEAIAAWLDEKCGEIDAAIAKVDREIELIDELKQSEISRVVTRGLNPDAPLRPSGIDWVVDVPEHWKICRVKHLVQFNSGDTITSEQLSDDGDFPVYGANGYRGRFHKHNFENRRILIGRVGALCGNVHYTNEKIWCSEHALISSESFGGLSFDYHWLCRLFESMNLNQYGGGSAQPVIASSTIENLAIVYPPINEQQAIADYLDKKCAEIDGLKAKLTKKRETLTELRQSIISEVVTGKQKVI